MRAEVPNVRFHFLGTGVAEDGVLADLEILPCDWVRIVPGFPSSDLPKLVSEAAVGALPSYIEGFPFGVLELLAAGLPVAAYDVPGPRSMLRNFNFPLMSPPGKPGLFAESLIRILKLPPVQYEALCENSRAVARSFQWRQIATQTLAAYTGSKDGPKTTRRDAR